VIWNHATEVIQGYNAAIAACENSRHWREALHLFEEGAGGCGESLGLPSVENGT